MLIYEVPTNVLLPSTLDRLGAWSNGSVKLHYLTYVPHIHTSYLTGSLLSCNFVSLDEKTSGLVSVVSIVLARG